MFRDFGISMPKHLAGQLVLKSYKSTIKYSIFLENKNSFVTFATEILDSICYYINKVKKHKVTNTKYK